MRGASVVARCVRRARSTVACVLSRRRAGARPASLRVACSVELCLSLSPCPEHDCCVARVLLLRRRARPRAVAVAGWRANGRDSRLRCADGRRRGCAKPSGRACEFGFLGLLRRGLVLCSAPARGCGASGGRGCRCARSRRRLRLGRLQACKDTHPQFSRRAALPVSNSAATFRWSCTRGDESSIFCKLRCACSSRPPSSVGRAQGP